MALEAVTELVPEPRRMASELKEEVKQSEETSENIGDPEVVKRRNKLIVAKEVSAVSRICSSEKKKLETDDSHVDEENGVGVTHNLHEKEGEEEVEQSIPNQPHNHVPNRLSLEVKRVFIVLSNEVEEKTEGDDLE